MKEIRYILILVIGSALFWVGVGLALTHPLPSDWIKVIPNVAGSGSMNLTTSTFDVTSETWLVSTRLDLTSQYSRGARLIVEVYNASTDEKLQEFTFTLSTDGVVFSESHVLKMTGSFYLKIQAYGRIGLWAIEVEEYKPSEFPTWIEFIVMIGIALIVVVFGYEIYNVMK